VACQVHLRILKIIKNNKMDSKIVLVGKAASGKDHLRKLLINRGFKYGVSHTTRPPRKGEVDGIDYHFITVEDFKEMIKNDQLVEWQEFVGFYYGMHKDIFEKCDTLILNVEGLNMLPKEYRDRCFVIYLDIPFDARALRLSNRGDSHDPWERRINADEKQFKNFKNYDLRINNPDF